MSLVQEQSQFLEDVALLILEAKKLHITLTGGELFRTPEMQEIYIKTGKSKTSNSMHLKRLAIDFNFFIDDNLVYEHESITKLGKYWESLNPKNRWGGSWRGLIESGKSTFVDTPHFERQA